MITGNLFAGDGPVRIPSLWKSWPLGDRRVASARKVLGGGWPLQADTVGGYGAGGEVYQDSSVEPC